MTKRDYYKALGLYEDINAVNRLPKIQNFDNSKVRHPVWSCASRGFWLRDGILTKVVDFARVEVQHLALAVTLGEVFGYE